MKRVYYNISQKSTYLEHSLIKTFVEEADTINVNSVSYNSTFNAFRINNSTQKGSLHIPLGNLMIGDRVNVQVEFRNMSGVRGKIGLDRGTSTISNVGVVYSVQEYGQWDFLETSFSCNANDVYNLFIGLFTDDIGDIYIRNISIEIETNREIVKQDKLSYKEGRRIYNIRGGDGVISLQSAYSYDNCTINIDSSNKFIQITHDKPFTAKAGVAIAGISGASNVKYIAKTQTESKTGLRVKIYDSELKSFVDPSIFINDNTFWCSIVHFGYDGFDS